MKQGTRYLSSLSALALSFGYAVGWGAFVLPGTMFLPTAGPAGTIIGLLLGTMAIVVLAFNFHKTATTIRGTGGTYGFVAKAFGYNHGFLVGWFLFLTYVAILWANATALVLLARYLFGNALQFGFHYTMVGFDVYFGEVLLSLAAIVLCACLCIFSKRFSVRLHTFFAFVLVAGVAICFVAAVLRHEGGMAAMGPAFSTDSPEAIQILRILAMVPWAFVGFEAVVHSSSEFRFPIRRTFSLLLTAILLSALTYVLLAILPALALAEGYSSWKEYIDALPNLTGIDAMPVFSAARRALGPLGVAVIGGSMLSGQLTALFATYIAVSRLMRAMADDDMIPRWLGRCNGEGTPVNAILTAIIGYTELLLDGIDDQEERNKALSAISTSGHTLLQLINDVLDLSKLESGKMDIKPELTDVRELVSSVLHSFDVTTRNSDFVLKEEYGHLPLLEVDLRRSPRSSSQILPYLCFNFFYRKYGGFTEKVCALCGYERMGKAARKAAYWINQQIASAPHGIGNDFLRHGRETRGEKERLSQRKGRREKSPADGTAGMDRVPVHGGWERSFAFQRSRICDGALCLPMIKTAYPCIQDLKKTIGQLLYITDKKTVHWSGRFFADAQMEAMPDADQTPMPIERRHLKPQESIS